MKKGPVNIVGAGRAGKSLGKLLKDAGYKIDKIVARASNTAFEAVQFIGEGESLAYDTEHFLIGGIIILSVPDDEIETVCSDLVKRSALEKGSVLFHLCGNYSSLILHPAKTKHIFIASLHPLKSFANPDIAVKTFPGTYCFYEGDPQAEKVLRQLINDIKGIAVKIKSEEKVLYHAAAVMGSNFIVSLLYGALQLLKKCGVSEDDAIKALSKLAEGTINNVRELGPLEALTGPIDRQDLKTIRRHLDSLKEADGRLLSLYLELAKLTCEVAKNKGVKVDKIHKLLEEFNI